MVQMKMQRNFLITESCVVNRKKSKPFIMMTSELGWARNYPCIFNWVRNKGTFPPCSPLMQPRYHMACISKFLLKWGTVNSSAWFESHRCNKILIRNEIHWVNISGLQNVLSQALWCRITSWCIAAKTGLGAYGGRSCFYSKWGWRLN